MTCSSNAQYEIKSDPSFSSAHLVCFVSGAIDRGVTSKADGRLEENAHEILQEFRADYYVFPSRPG